MTENMLEPAQNTAPKPNVAFGKYRLVASLGHGGMADVYLAVAEGPAGFNKLQVLKRLRHDKDLNEESDLLKMFMDEARLTARLNHPNIVQTNEVGQVGQDHFIAMEYLDGQPLNRVLQAARNNPPPPGFFVSIFADVLAGLQYAHDLKDYNGTPLGIVHRDVSPHNIFVTYEGQTKVVDFGIAKATNRSSAQTNAGVIKGKFGYMAPEQATGAADPRTDVFILGIVMWEALASRRMWKGISDMEIVRCLIHGEIPSLIEVNPSVNPALAAICNRALAIDPKDRYQTAVKMRRDLIRARDSEGLAIDPEDVGKYIAKAFASRRAQIAKVVEAQLNRVTSLADITSISESGSQTMPSPMSGSLPVIGSLSGSSVADLNGDVTKDAPLDSGSLSNPISAGSGPSSPGLSASGVSASGAGPGPASATSSSPGGALAPATPVAAPQNNKSRALLLGAAAVVVALGVGFAMRGNNHPPPVAVESKTASAPAVVVATATQAPVTAGSIEITVRADPPNARIFLDDAALPQNPYVGRFPADHLGHRLRVEASGYQAQTQIVSFDRDVVLTLALAQSAAPPVAEPKGGPWPTRPAAAPVEAPTAAPTTALSAPKPSKRPLEDPFDGTAPKPPTKRPLDSAEPWGN
jgi:serine/threonine-protein kinase